VGGARYRSADNEGFVDTVFLGAFRRKVFKTVGMYDPRAITNEDAELNQRIIHAGGKVFQSRDVIVHYYPRDSFVALAKQYFRYGKGRARTLLKHKKFLSVRPVIPFLGVLGGAALLATSPWQPITLFAFAGYAMATLGEALRVGRRMTHVPLVWAIFPVLHIAHGTGCAVGLAEYAVKRDWPREHEKLESADVQEGVARAAAN
jgi:hypothetical protein